MPIMTPSLYICCYERIFKLIRFAAPEMCFWQ